MPPSHEFDSSHHYRCYGIHRGIFSCGYPYALVALCAGLRARGWSRGRTMAVALFAGLGHVALTTLLGLLIAWLGFQLDEEIGHAFAPLVATVLVTIGLYYWWRQLRGGGICHHAMPGSQHHADEHCGDEPEHDSHWEHELKDSRLASISSGDWTAISGLFLMLTLSPCEAFLPVYLSAVQFGWSGFIILSLILAVATLAGMTVFTWLTLIGFEKLKLRYFEKWEAGLLGTIFVLLGVMFLVLKH